MVRFFLEPEQWRDGAELSGDEARHCARVMRLQPGDRIEVFDGLGRGAGAVIRTVARDSVGLELEETVFEPSPSVGLRLSQSILKGKAMEWVIQKAVELGVTEIRPLRSARVIGKPGDDRADKWRRIALEACKQCGRWRVPTILPVLGMDELLAEGGVRARAMGALRPGSVPLRRWLEESAGATDYDFLVGPEGDFTDEEASRAVAAGYRPCSLGPQVLRSETAALFGLSSVSCWVHGHGHGEIS